MCLPKVSSSSSCRNCECDHLLRRLRNTTLELAVGTVPLLSSRRISGFYFSEMTRSAMERGHSFDSNCAFGRDSPDKSAWLQVPAKSGMGVPEESGHIQRSQVRADRFRGDSTSGLLVICPATDYTYSECAALRTLKRMSWDRRCP